ncbi:MAG: hypothetical protein PW788_07760 [Micavibrio sp.]|nr:hypothetical protein [Micavibrio sp.]
MKPLRDYFKRPATDAADKPGLLKAVKNRLRRSKDVSPTEKEGKSLPDLAQMREKLADMMDSSKRSKTANTVLVLTGAGVAAVGVAADVMFLGGVGTITVISCLYSDLRNVQHIKKISAEIGKIDDKIDEMARTSQPGPDYAPALSAVKSSIEDFQASAKKVPPEVSVELARLKEQVTALQAKITPAPKP